MHDPRTNPAPQPAKKTAPHVFDVTVNTFQKDVVDRSRTTPVLVDLWATWCGPCKTLGPTLEKLAAEMDGRFVVAKVDVDQNPEISDAFNVQSIPTVILLVGGRAVDGFVGAQPEARIREMLARHLPKPPGPLEEALALEKAGDQSGAITKVRDLVRKKPREALFKAHLARLLVLTGQEAEGRLLYDSLTDDEKEIEPARAAKAHLVLLDSRGDLGPHEAAVRAAPDDVAARLAYGRALLAAGRTERGLEELYEGAKRDVRFNDSEPRRALLEAFDALGAGHPLVNEYRRRLSLLLCA